MRNPEAIAWTIASEGYITLRKNHNSFQPRIGMANTNEDFISRFYDMVGEVGHVYYYKHKNHPEHKGKWFWELYSTGDCLEFLMEIKDYLPIKREQANIVIKYCIRSLDRIIKSQGVQRGSKESKEIYKLSEDDINDFNTMAKLNTRGTGLCP